jgi:outer membrane protein
MTKRRISAWLVLVAALPAAWAAPPPDSLTVADVVRLTLESQPLLQQAEAGAAVADARVGVARAGLYPEVAATGDYMRLGPVSHFDLPEGRTDLYPADNLDLHLGLVHTLYDFGRVRAGVGLAESARRAAGDNLAAVESNLAYQAIDAFYRVLILRRTITVLDEEIAALREHLEAGASRIRAGTATDFDTLTTAVRVAVARNGRTDALQALANQEIALRRLTGLPVDRPILLRGAFAVAEIGFDPDSLAAAARAQRPELALARDAVASAAFQTRMAALGEKPSLALSATSGFKNGYFPGLSTLKANYTAGVRLEVPVFEGYRTRYRREEADADRRAAEARVADLERQVDADVARALTGVRSSREKIRATEVQLHQAEQALAMARTRYEAGVATNLDLLDAETALAEVKLIRWRAFYEYTAGRNDLDRATGRKLW